MSTISSVLSTAKPVNPNPGSLFYFTDTKQIAIYQGGGVYYAYNRDTLAYSSGGEEQLNYPGGLFNSSSSDYYLTVSPAYHFDATYIDGTQPTPFTERTDLGTAYGYDGNAGNLIWGNRGSESNKHITTSSGDTTGKFYFNSEHVGVENNTWANISGSLNTDKKFTLITAHIPDNSERYVTFGHYNDPRYSPAVLYDVQQHMGGGFTNSSAVRNGGKQCVVANQLGLSIVQCEGHGKMVNFYSPTSTLATVDADGRWLPHYSLTTSSINMAFHRMWLSQNYTAQGVWCEILLFDGDLSQENMDKVTKYLYNKYTNRLHSSLGLTNKVIYDDPTTWKLFKKGVRWDGATSP